MTKLDFDEVYAANKANVWKLVARYVSSRQDREDLFQEVFLKIHRALPKFRGESNLGTWIYRITVNTALNYLQQQKRYGRLKEILSGFRIMAEARPAEDLAEDEVPGPLKKLNPQQRMILVLAEVEEKKLEEISRLLGLPIGTVKSNLHRAKKIIRKELGDHG